MEDSARAGNGVGCMTAEGSEVELTAPWEVRNSLKHFTCACVYIYMCVYMFMYMGSEFCVCV